MAGPRHGFMCRGVPFVGSYPLTVSGAARRGAGGVSNAVVTTVGGPGAPRTPSPFTGTTRNLYDVPGSSLVTVVDGFRPSYTCIVEEKSASER